MLELYYAPHTCSLVTHIALVEAGADFKLHLVDLYENEQSGQRYLARGFVLVYYRSVAGRRWC
jgi:glutathione S-transferase